MMLFFNLALLLTSTLEWVRTNSPLSIVAAILAVISLFVTAIENIESIVLKARKLRAYLIRRRVPDLIREALRDGKLTKAELLAIVRAVVVDDEVDLGDRNVS